ncbi:Na(+)-translocating NADH:ubiquinone oxidoreductase A subunit [Hoeflea halophila]|uniref:Na(+)-translocating NADH:ubiquinone oxidoreductase A subunit n=1 Tax=Hoeflea halophila TaxID=714899 RepID=A0A286IDN9_9HYPH|nr:hypothetical protein [Hoeflea halophila]SOE18238.1 Na(+)-translocating NADH:ubiquinone oxidoreductase A subunit [Hoeflea halophila]
MQNFTFRNGIAAPSPEPDQPFVELDRKINALALLGENFRGPKWKPVVAVGDRIACGDQILCDRHNSNITLVSPASGEITAIERGARRSIQRIAIKANAPEPSCFEKRRYDHAPPTDREALVRLLLSSGLWTAFKTRPFGLVPDPPKPIPAIFINACCKSGNSPDPAKMLQEEFRWFAAGVDAIGLLAEEAVFVCQQAAQPLCNNNGRKLRIARFSGAYCSALSGTHVHALRPQTGTNPVLTVDWQDTLAIGRLVNTGTVSWRRQVGIGGDNAGTRAVATVPVGSDLKALATGLRKKSNFGSKRSMTVLSGDPVSGVPAAYLHRFDDVVTLTSKRDVDVSGRGNLRINAITPYGALIDALPFGQPALPLMRALTAHDLETVEALGADKMLEADVAQLSRVCTSGADYGVLLRHALDELAEARS